MDNQETSNKLIDRLGKPWLISIAFGISLYAALPYINFWPLAYIALILLICVTRFKHKPKRYYFQVWLGCYVHWLLACWFATRPHWAGFIGWVFMAGYLSLYYLLFVAFSRSLLARFRRFEVIIYPIVWVSLEWLRGHVITGYSQASLSHTHYELPIFIQVSDLFGSYTLSFVIAFVSTCLVLLLANKSIRKKCLYATMAIAAVSATLAYGAYRISENRLPDAEPLSIAIIQGSMDTVFPWTQELQDQSVNQYRDLTIAARKAKSDLDLIMWPESAYPVLLDPETPPEERTPDPVTFNFLYFALVGSASLPSDPPDTVYFPNRIPLLTGINTNAPSKKSVYNSATLIDQDGNIVNTYHKNHLVMFGEYIPFGDKFPVLYDLAPIPRGLAAGNAPELIKINGYGICANICFESTVPHFIRSQLNRLESNGQNVDIIANVSNDGWFWGSNCLDQHFASNVFRSVENRKPTIAAVNTGFSAHIDGNGIIVKKGGRRSPEYLLVEVYRDGRDSLYRLVGDWPVIGLSILVLAGVIFSRYSPSRQNQRDPKT